MVKRIARSFVMSVLFCVTAFCMQGCDFKELGIVKLSEEALLAIESLLSRYGYERAKEECVWVTQNDGNRRLVCVYLYSPQ